MSKIKDYTGSVRGLLVKLPGKDNIVELVSTYQYKDNGVGLWYKEDGNSSKVKPITFENIDDVLELDVYGRNYG